MAQPIYAGERGRRIRFVRIKLDWVTPGYSAKLVVVSPDVNVDIVVINGLQVSGSVSSADFLTIYNPFPTPGDYKIQLEIRDGGGAVMRRGLIRTLKILPSLMA